MTDNAFDAAGFIQVNLEAGTIQTPGQRPMALIPLELFQSILASTSLKEAARNWGKQRGHLFGDTASATDATLDILAQHLAGEVAMMGAGSCEINVIGDALLLQVASGQAFSESFAGILEGFLAGYLGAVSAVDFSTLSSGAGTSELRIFVGNASAVSWIRGQLNEGVSILDAVTHLHREVA